MGDRICLSFVNEELKERSPCLYAHWAGMDLIEYAREFWEKYHESVRGEPSNFMVNFISYLRGGHVQDGGYYLYKDEDHACSPDDNGYWEFDVKTGWARSFHKHNWEEE